MVYGAARSSLGNSLGALFAVIAKEAVADWCMKDFKSQGLSNTAFAFTTVGHKDEWLFKAVAVTA